MKKSEVLGYFGGVVKTAAALGTSKTTVSMWGEEVPWKWALLIQAVTAGALKYELHIPTVVIPGSDHNPPSNQGGIHENQASTHPHADECLGASGRRKSTGCENYQSVFRAGNDVPGTV